MSEQITITDTQKLEPMFYDWGGLKWVCNGDMVQGCTSSIALVNVLPGRTNPEHWHSLAEEIVYMLAGELEIKFGGNWVKLRAGQTAHIPAGLKHVVANRGWEPAIYVATFTASFRGTEFEDPNAVGAQPSGKSGY